MSPRPTTYLSVLVMAAAAAGPASGATRMAQVTVSGGPPLHTFRPDQALGAGVDGHAQGDTALIYTPANIRAMRSAGFGALSYRLRTELGAEAWHWSPWGRFSAGGSGYWSSRPGPATVGTYGYALPRRGNTVDQANDAGWSRLDDGNARTFWKSNPYLDPYYVPGRENHPQWVVIDLQERRAVDALRIDWGSPYATTFRVERWIGPSAIVQNGHALGRWRAFPRGQFTGHGGRQALRLADRPLQVRFVRVLLTRSSHTGPRASRDIRDRLGYAIRELYLGRATAAGLHDLVRHRPNGRQTVTYASSTDPWHRPTDRDAGTEQPSFATVVRSGLAAGQPLLVPVPVLYGTPAEAVAELRYLKSLGVQLRGVELGEEPDGQLASPEDYGALYIEFARAIHRAFPGLPLGGPGYQTSIPDWYAWPDQRGNRSWTGRFVSYLRARRSLGELSFFAFEWYPFDNTCAPPGPQLARAASTLEDVVRRQRADGLPPDVPLVITEYGYSAFAGRAEADLPGALLNADVAGKFLALGGTTAYLYGYEPDVLTNELVCGTWGNLTLLLADAGRRIRQPLATFWAAQLLTQQWAQPGDGLHGVLGTTVRLADGGDPQLLGAYAVRRPDGRTALMLLNKDATRPAAVSVAGVPGAAYDSYLFGPAQYVWHPGRANGFARPDLPPVHAVVAAGATVELPPLSIVVLRTA